jgi:hypothetical protein
VKIVALFSHFTKGTGVKLKTKLKTRTEEQAASSRLSKAVHSTDDILDLLRGFLEEVSHKFMAFVLKKNM